jgi:hypothetical protein
MSTSKPWFQNVRFVVHPPPPPTAKLEPERRKLLACAPRGSCV